MIAFLKGTIAEKTQDIAVIETGGIGYAVYMSTNDLSQLPETGEAVHIHTYLQVREDALTLFGFLTLEEKVLFLRLISVSGVGPKIALSALSMYSPENLISYITNQDITAISRVSGLGKKTASRIVLELKGSLDQDFLGLEGAVPSGGSQALRGAHEALLSMGFTSDEADIALKGAPEATTETGLLQYALKRLGQ